MCTNVYPSLGFSRAVKTKEKASFYICTKLHDITSQNTITFIFAEVRTPNRANIQLASTVDVFRVTGSLNSLPNFLLNCGCFHFTRTNEMVTEISELLGVPVLLSLSSRTCHMRSLLRGPRFCIRVACLGAGRRSPVGGRGQPDIYGGKL